jgi:hypothetical protein
MEIAHAIHFRERHRREARRHALLAGIVDIAGVADSFLREVSRSPRGRREATASIDLRFKSVMEEYNALKARIIGPARPARAGPFAIVLAGVTRPVARVVNNFRVQRLGALAVGCITLAGKPVGIQTARRGITGAGQRALEGIARGGRIERGQRTRVKQCGFGLVARLRMRGKQLLKRGLRIGMAARGNLGARQPSSNAGSDANGPLAAA